MTILRKPPLARVIEDAIEHRLATLGVCMPAKVLAFNPPSGQEAPTVDVQPSLGWTVLEEDREASGTMHPITGVPLLFPGSGAYRLTFPIAVGDFVLLVCADKSTDEFMADGSTKAPADLRTHDWSDAFAIPGVLPNTGVLSGVSTSVMVLGKNGNPHQPAARKNDAVIIGPNASPGTPLVLSCVALAQGATSIQITAPITDAKINAGSNDVEIT